MGISSWWIGNINAYRNLALAPVGGVDRKLHILTGKIKIAQVFKLKVDALAFIVQNILFVSLVFTDKTFVPGLHDDFANAGIGYLVKDSIEEVGLSRVDVIGYIYPLFIFLDGGSDAVVKEAVDSQPGLSNLFIRSKTGRGQGENV